MYEDELDKKEKYQDFDYEAYWQEQESSRYKCRTCRMQGTEECTFYDIERKPKGCADWEVEE